MNSVRIRKTPRFSRYRLENVGDGDLELLHVAAYTTGATDGGRTDVEAQRLSQKAKTFSTVRPAKAWA